MKTLLLATVLIAATGAVAAPDAPANNAPAAQTAPAIALSAYDQLTLTAKAQFDAKDFAGAQKSVEESLELAQTPKEKSDALRRLGLALNGQKRYAQARETWQKMAPLIQDSPEDLYSMRLAIASSYSDEEMWPQAVAAFVELVNEPRVENKSLFRMALATAYNNLKQTDKAREQLAIVTADPTAPATLRATAQIFLGKTYAEASNFDKAREQFANVVADPTVPAALRGLAQISIGQAYFDQSNLGEARRSVEAAEKIPGFPRDFLIGTQRLLAEIAEKQNRPEDAAKAYSTQRVFLMIKAVDQANAKDLEGAIASYKAALNAGTPEIPIELGVRLQIGNAQTKLGQYEDARVEFQKVLDAAPMRLNATETQSDNPFKIGAYLGLARIDIAEKKFDVAREKLNKALQIPNLPEKSAVLVEDLLNSLPPKP